MSANYVDVSKEITLSGKHGGPDVPVIAYGVFYPDKDEVKNIGASAARPNPKDEDGIYEIHVDGNTMLLSGDQMLAGDLFRVYEDEITTAAREAAKSTHV